MKTHHIIPLCMGLFTLVSAHAVITDNLVFYAPYDTTTSNTINPPGQTATVVGTPGPSLSTTQAKFGTQSLYNPVADNTTNSALGYADGAPSFDVGTGSYAMSAWINLSINPTGTTVRQYLFRGMNGATQNLAFYVRDQRVLFFLEQGASDIDMITPVGSLTGTGSWVNLIANIYDDGSSRTVDLYINGTLSATQTKAAIGNDLFSNMYLAGTNNAGFGIQQGYMDDAAIWTRTLTSGEIASIQTSAIPEPSTVALGMAALAGLLTLRRRRN